VPGLYLHIPFCEKKCVYCDFYSIERTEQTPAFLGALATEIDLVADSLAPTEEFSTIFLGGGTPSLLAPSQLELILAHLHRRFRIHPQAEVTLESNPGTIGVEKLRAYRGIGVNRLSIGIQSFNDDELAFLGRIHDAAQGTAAVDAARRAGFDNISIDLMFALPMHDHARWERTLRQAVALAPEHISAYSLIFEEGTPLFAQLQHGEVAPLAEETDADLYLYTVEFLAAHGLRQYEVSNYARPIPGAQATGDAAHDLLVSHHNLNYWRRGEYLSFGPSAHSFRNGERWWNHSNLGSYLASLAEGAIPVGNRERLTTEQALTEAISLGLRSDGIWLRPFRDFFKFDFLARCGARCTPMVEAGLLTVDAEAVRSTPRGYLLNDAIALELLQHLSSCSPQAGDTGLANLRQH
jgi:oxygen-independent coproporphyrinogen-3 oxidase